MYCNVVDLRDFYDSGMGRIVRRILRQKIRQIWPDMVGMSVLGMGFSTPYLGVFNGVAERVFAVMPPEQGALHWPHGEPSQVAMAQDDMLPFETGSIDRVLMVHSFEFSRHQQHYLREIWRVLSEKGRVLVIVPNRAGVWARADHTPFGRGTPYSIGQMQSMLRENMFMPERAERALYVPPVNSRFILTAARAYERVGSRFFSTFGGLNLIEGSKHLFAATPLYVAEKIRKRQIVVPGVEVEPS